MVGAAGAVGVISQGRKVLVLRRSLADEFLPGGYDLPGGGLEPGESADDAVKREVFEETGIPVSIVSRLGTTSFVSRKDGKRKVLAIFLLKPNGDDRKVVLSQEHDEYRWIDGSGIDALFGPENLMGKVLRRYFAARR